MNKRTPEEHREFNKHYMRARRNGTWVPTKSRHANRSASQSQESAKRSDALYDPARDGQPVHENITAMLMGDPPIGRRALDRS